MVIFQPTKMVPTSPSCCDLVIRMILHEYLFIIVKFQSTKMVPTSSCCEVIRMILHECLFIIVIFCPQQCVQLLIVVVKSLGWFYMNAYLLLWTSPSCEVILTCHHTSAFFCTAHLLFTFVISSCVLMNWIFLFSDSRSTSLTSDSEEDTPQSTSHDLGK